MSSKKLRKLKIIIKYTLACLFCNLFKSAELSKTRSQLIAAHVYREPSSHNSFDSKFENTSHIRPISHPNPTMTIQLDGSANSTQFSSKQPTESDLVGLGSVDVARSSYSPLTEPVFEPVTMPLGSIFNLSSSALDRSLQAHGNSTTSARLRPQPLPLAARIDVSGPTSALKSSSNRPSEFVNLASDFERGANLHSNPLTRKRPTGSSGWSPVERKRTLAPTRPAQDPNQSDQLASWANIVAESKPKVSSSLSDASRYIYLNQMATDFEHASYPVSTTPAPSMIESFLRAPRLKLKGLLDSGTSFEPSSSDGNQIWSTGHQLTSRLESPNLMQIIEQAKQWPQINPPHIKPEPFESQHLDHSLAGSYQEHLATASDSAPSEPIELTLEQLNNALQVITSKAATLNAANSAPQPALNDRDLLAYLSAILKSEIANQEKQKSSHRLHLNASNNLPQTLHQMIMYPPNTWTMNTSVFEPPTTNPQSNSVHGGHQIPLMTVQSNPNQVDHSNNQGATHIHPLHPPIVMNSSQGNQMSYLQTPSEFSPTTLPSTRNKKNKSSKGQNGSKRNTKKSSRPLIHVKKNPLASESNRMHEVSSPNDLQPSSTFHKWKRPFYDEDEGEEGETEVNIRFFNNFSRMGPFAGIARTSGAVALVVSLAFLVISNVSLATTLIAHGIYNLLRNQSDDPMNRNRFFKHFDKFRRNHSNQTHTHSPIKALKLSTTEAPIRSLDQHIRSLGDAWKTPAV